MKKLIKNCKELAQTRDITVLTGNDILTAHCLNKCFSTAPGRGPVPGPGINYTGPREVLLEFVILVF